MVLPAPPDTAAIRRKLDTQLSGDVSKLGAMPYNPTYDQQASNLYGQLGTKYAGYDLAENRTGQDYQTQLAQTQRSQGLERNAIRDTMANRGNLFSGAYVDQQANLNTKYQDIYNRLNTNRQRGLEDIGRGRAASMADYQTGLGDIESGYAQSVGNYLQQQAAAAASAEQSRAQQGALAQLMGPQNANAQNQYSTMQQILEAINSQKSLLQQLGLA